MDSAFLIAGYGFLGQALAEVLADSEQPAIALRKTESTGSVRRSIPVRSCDIADTGEVSQLALAIPTPGVIVHCASSNRGGADAYKSVFVEGTRNLQSTFPEARLFLTSSTSVYGQTDGSEVTEDSPTEPERETGHVLCQAEKLVIEIGGTVLRLAGLYGPGRSVYLQRFLEGTATIESGEVSRFLNQIHRDDAASAIVHLIGLPSEMTAGETFNVSDGSPITQRACLEGMAAIFDRPFPAESTPDLNRKRAWTHKAISNTKLRATGWAPRYPDFLEAIREDARLIPSIEERINQS